VITDWARVLPEPIVAVSAADTVVAPLS